MWKNPWCPPYMHGTLPTAKTYLSYLEDGTPFDRKEFRKGTSSPHRLVLGFTPPTSFLTTSSLGDINTVNILLHTVWNLSRG